MVREGKKIIHEGVLDLNGIDIPCYVLEDGTRVLSGRNMQSALKMVDDTDENKKTSGTRLNRYLEQKSLKPYIFKDREEGHFAPIECYKGNQKINGYEATVLADICEAFLEARQNLELSTRQKIIADQCEILIRSFARVGIIALVDEATGYQYERESQELQKVLKSYINNELLPWQKKFPDDFYKQIFRLNGWGHFMSGNIDIKNRPGVIGTWTKNLIYKQLPKGVLEELKNKTPKTKSGNYAARFHQNLTPDVGQPHLQQQLTSVITIMRLSKDWKDFEEKFNQLYGQTRIEFSEKELDAQ